MSDNTPYEPEQPVDSSRPEPMDWREERARRREERHEARWARRGSQGWIWGAVLILIGLILLLQNFGFPYLSNWWALFILVPAVGSLAAAWNIYRDAGNRLVAPARGSLIGGILLTMVAMLFLFNMNWSLLWPILLILAGVGALLNALLPG